MIPKIILTNKWKVHHGSKNVTIYDENGKVTDSIDLPLPRKYNSFFMPHFFDIKEGRYKLIKGFFTPGESIDMIIKNIDTGTLAHLNIFLDKETFLSSLNLEITDTKGEKSVTSIINQPLLTLKEVTKKLPQNFTLFNLIYLPLGSCF